jgi:preprotein translocase subunit SecA
MLEILNALKAKHIFKLNKDYIVLKIKVLIVDEFSGRIMEDRRWSLGIHEAIEIKECVTLGKTRKVPSLIRIFYSVSETCWDDRNCQNDREFQDINLKFWF